MAAIAASSPLSDLPTSSTAYPYPVTHSELRRTKEIPHEVVQSIQTYYEEDLNAQGFDFLYALTANSTSAQNPASEVLVPPVSHLGLAATLCVHPSTTTRTEDPAKLAQSAAAFRLLRLLQRVSGHHIAWQQALRFRKYETFFHVDSKATKDIYTHIDSKHKYTETNSLFTRAEDFWSVVGWAFNCACLPDAYAARWDFYGPFLNLMLDILECDFDHHAKQDTLDESVLWSFIELSTGGYSRSRRIVRAIFADGTSRSLNEFREIFNKELRPPKKAEEKPIKAEVDVDNNEFAEYDGPSSGNVSEDEVADTRPNKRVRLRSTRSRTPSAKASNESLNEGYESDAANQTATLGPPEALRLRARLVRLLAEIVNYPSLTAHSPTTFVDRDELYTLFVEFIKRLPLNLFQELTLPNTYTGSVLDAVSHTRLCEAILKRTLESRAPATADGGLLTAAWLIQCYLPYGASGSGVDAQTRVSILVEALTRGAHEQKSLRGENGADVEVLQWATEEGVKRREDYAKEAMGSRKKGRKKGGGAEEDAWRALRESGARLRALVQRLE